MKLTKEEVNFLELIFDDAAAASCEYDSPDEYQKYEAKIAILHEKILQQVEQES